MAKKKARKIARKKIKARKQKIKKICKPCNSKIVVKKCIKCKAPLSGFMHKYVGRPIFGLKPSKKKKGYCNKCE